MMLDIFSSFDPACNSVFTMLPSGFWALSFTVFILFSSMWLTPSQTSFLWTAPINMMADQSSRTSTLHLKGLPTIITPLFTMLIFINLSGLMPYLFSPSSHIIFTFSLALPLWLSMILSSMTKNLSSFTAGLIPSGAPGWLNPFLLIIEMLSISARPITLSFRLAANMSTGHIVLSLVTIYLVMSFFSPSYTSMVPLYLVSVFYTMFEIGICLMQAYIFCLLLTLYSNEHSL
uniref:ATP synthase F0 subunit 6 n=1 Tax=Pseudopotamilla reniformis TaxID=279639 RepID=UPI001FAF59AF|nr:ATP synthase F0 subunit 6 [Pseudopotamilla reniformis]ULD67136.1 ATP synthase F0 subunit 6 [Pseudopotamilla reniformis]